MSWNLWALFLAPLLLHGASTPLTAQELAQFEQRCKEGVHVSCVREGMSWLRTKTLRPAQRHRLLLFVAGAHLSLGQDAAARAAIRRAIKLAPCQPAPQGLPRQAAQLFRLIQREVFQADQAPPILTHIPPAPHTFRRKGQLFAKATDDLQIRDVVLFYRPHPKGSYQRLPFKQIAPTRYRVQVPPKQLAKIAQFHYYIRARDCANNSTTNEADASHPTKLIFERQGSSGKTIGASLLIALGGALLVSSSLLFVSANTEQKRWKNTQDLVESEQIRGRIILYHALGWSGIGAGLLLAAGGTYLLVPPTTWRHLLHRPSAPAPTPPPSNNQVFSWTLQ